MRYDKLRGKIREVFGSEKRFAEAMERNPSTISLRLNGRSDWDKPDMEKACALLGIPLAEVHTYFF